MRQFQASDLAPRLPWQVGNEGDGEHAPSVFVRRLHGRLAVRARSTVVNVIFQFTD
jgi:hypothetical protein